MTNGFGVATSARLDTCSPRRIALLLDIVRLDKALIRLPHKNNDVSDAADGIQSRIATFTSSWFVGISISVSSFPLTRLRSGRSKPCTAGSRKRENTQPPGTLDRSC